jgi:hypothetical protein
MPPALRRLCTQIRTECMERMKADGISHDEYVLARPRPAVATVAC